MIVGYARVSTQEQNEALQISALRDAQCEKIFTDKMSGARDDRPQFNKCMGFLQRGDVLVAWKIDRLGRSLRHLVNTVHELEAKGVGLRIVTAPIDTTTAPGKLVFGIFAALAEFERELIKERTRAGIKAAKDKGVKFGRPVKVTPELVATAKALIATHSVPTIANGLGIGRSTLYAALQGEGAHDNSDGAGLR